jgi:hypothetical protein
VFFHTIVVLESITSSGRRLWTHHVHPLPCVTGLLEGSLPDRAEAAGDGGGATGEGGIGQALGRGGGERKYHGWVHAHQALP